MNEKKLVFFDIDGTLLDDDKQIPDSTIEAIQSLQNKGITTAIATGRAPFMFKDICLRLGIESFISFNGQYVVKDGQAIYKNPIARPSLGRLSQHATDHNYPLAYLSSEGMAATHDNHPLIQKSFGSLKLDPPKKRDGFHDSNDIYQALLFCQEEDDVTAFETLEELGYIRWHPYSMDVLPLGGSKAEGIKKMVEILGFNRDQVIAFGDAMNDLEMLRYAGTGVAMGNAIKEAKAAADEVTTPVKEDGIWHGLKQLGLL